MICFCAVLKKDSQHYFPFPEIITIFAPHFESKNGLVKKQKLLVQWGPALVAGLSNTF